MMQLSHAQKRFFYDEGYLHIPGVIPQVMVKAARKAINHSLGQEGMHPDKLNILRSQSYCPEIQRSEAIRNLIMATPAWDYAQSLTGEGSLEPITAGQIALRFPTLQDPPPIPRPHLDGMYTPHNGMEPGKLVNFTMLIGVLLSDVTETYAGNFTVYPKTHHLFERYFQENTPESLLEGMPAVEMPEPLQVLGKAGDIVLAHYQLAHTAMCNTSDSIRYACFFRLWRKGHEANTRACMLDIWKEWDGIREIIPAPNLA